MGTDLMMQRTLTALLIVFLTPVLWVWQRWEGWQLNRSR